MFLDETIETIFGPVVPDNQPAVLALVLTPLVLLAAATWARRQAGTGGWPGAVAAAMVRSTTATRYSVSLILLTAVVHLVLAAAQILSDTTTAVLFFLDGVVMVAVCIAAFIHRFWRLGAAAVLLASLGAYFFYAATGKIAPDAIALTTKVIEALALVSLAFSGNRLARLETSEAA